MRPVWLDIAFATLTTLCLACGTSSEAPPGTADSDGGVDAGPDGGSVAPDAGTVQDCFTLTRHQQTVTSTCTMDSDCFGYRHACTGDLSNLCPATFATRNEASMAHAEYHAAIDACSK